MSMMTNNWRGARLHRRGARLHIALPGRTQKVPGRLYALYPAANLRYLRNLHRLWRFLVETRHNLRIFYGFR